MARTMGWSGPLMKVFHGARSLGYDGPAGDLRALDAYERRLAHEVDGAGEAARRSVHAEIETLREQVDRGSMIDAAERASVEARAADAMAGIEAFVAYFNRPAAVSARVLNASKIGTARARAEEWRSWRTAELASIDRNAGVRANRLRDLETSAVTEVARRVAPGTGPLRALQALMQSQEMAGARAESAVAELLSPLPDAFFVLNHLHLVAPGFLRHNDKVVQSAEVDHLVVGPTGVFLLETKNWSRAFAESGAYFDPFEQVERAGFLCHVLLKDAKAPAPVRTVVVPFGVLPPGDPGKFIDVVEPPRLRHHIETRRPSLSAVAVQRIVDALWIRFGSDPRPAG